MLLDTFISFWQTSTAKGLEVEHISTGILSKKNKFHFCPEEIDSVDRLTRINGTTVFTCFNTMWMVSVTILGYWSETRLLGLTSYISFSGFPLIPLRNWAQLMFYMVQLD